MNKENYQEIQNKLYETLLLIGQHANGRERFLEAQLCIAKAMELTQEKEGRRSSLRISKEPNGLREMGERGLA